MGCGLDIRWILGQGFVWVQQDPENLVRRPTANQSQLFQKRRNLGNCSATSRARVLAILRVSESSSSSGSRSTSIKNPKSTPPASNSRFTRPLGGGAMSDTSRHAVGDLSISKRIRESVFSRERSTEYPLPHGWRHSIRNISLAITCSEQRELVICRIRPNAASVQIICRSCQV